MITPGSDYKRRNSRVHWAKRKINMDTGHNLNRLQGVVHKRHQLFEIISVLEKHWNEAKLCEHIMLHILIIYCVYCWYFHLLRNNWPTKIMSCSALRNNRPKTSSRNSSLTITINKRKSNKNYSEKVLTHWVVKNEKVMFTPYFY